MFKQSDLDKVKRAVLRKYSIVAGLALDGIEIRISNDVDTACVVGERDEKGVLQVKEILVNGPFFENLTFAERVFVLAHETFHIALRHFSRAMKMPEKDAMRKYKEYCERETDERKREFMKAQYLKKYHELWNIATDACINAFLRKDGLAFPESVIDPKTGRKMTLVDMKEGFYQSAEKIYKYLVQKEEEKEQQQEQESESTNGQPNPSDKSSQSQEGQESSSTSIDDVSVDDYVGIDSHDEWSGDDKDSSKTQEETSSETTADEEDDTDNIDEGNFFDKIIKSRQDGKVAEGSVPKALSKIRSDAGLQDFEAAKPILSWKTLLVGYLESIDEVWGTRRSSRYNPNARIEERTFEKRPDVEIILDTSGSISSSLLKGFLLQLYFIYQTVYGDEVSMKVGCFGTRFSGFTTIRSLEDIKNYHPTDGGGTNFEVAATSFTPDPEKKCKRIVFTDGILGHPQRTRVDNVMWIVFGNSMNFKPIGGRVIRVSDEDYNSMISDGQQLIIEDNNTTGKRR